MGFVGIALLLSTNLLTLAVALFGAFVYLVLYTPLKRRTSLCTIVGETGFFIGNMKFLHATGSDFVFFQSGRIIDEACRLNRKFFVKKLSSILVLNDDGTLDETFAKMLESNATDALKSIVSGGHAKRAYVTIVRGDNLSAPGAKIRTRVRVRMHGYAKDIESEVGFEPNTVST